MYHPHDVTCSCGRIMRPLQEPHWDNTYLDSRDKYIDITFWCDCNNTRTYRFTLPHVFEDVAKTVLQYIRQQVDGVLLTDHIKLNTSKIILDSSVQNGLKFAFAYLQEKSLVYDVDLTDYSFKLTLLGWLMVWHGPY